MGNNRRKTPGVATAVVLNRNRQVPAEETPAFGAIAERFRRAGDLERAVTLCRDGLKKFPNHLSARVTLGWSLLDLGKYDEARLELEQALKRAPDNLAAIRGLAELHDRAEHTMLLPMDGPGVWPPDAETIDAVETGLAEFAPDAASAQVTAAAHPATPTDAPAASVPPTVSARTTTAEPQVAPAVTDGESDAKSHKKAKAAKRAAKALNREFEARKSVPPAPNPGPTVATVEPAASPPAAFGTQEVAVAGTPEPAIAARSVPDLEPAAGLAFEAALRELSPADDGVADAGVVELAATSSASVDVDFDLDRVVQELASDDEPLLYDEPVTQLASELSVLDTPVLQPAAELSALDAPLQPTVELSVSDEPIASLASEFAVLDTPTLQPTAEPSTPDVPVVHLASEFERPDAPADQPAVELSMSDDPVVALASEFAVLDSPEFQPAAELAVSVEPTVQPVVELSVPDEPALDLASELAVVDVPELQSVAEFSVVDPAITVGASNQTLVDVLAAERAVAEAGAVVEVVLEPTAEPVDLEALIAEVSALDVGAEAPGLAGTEIETPTGPVFELSNPTPEDFALPAEETNEVTEESLHSLSQGDEAVNELPLLSAIVSESLDVDAEAVALASGTDSDVPSGPVYELTNPTIDDLPEALDPDEDLVDGQALTAHLLGRSDYPILVAFEALPAVEPEPILAPPRVSPSLVALERLLKKVERRRLQLMAESVA